MLAEKGFVPHSDDTVDEAPAADEMVGLLGLSYEIQLKILTKLIPDPEFISHLLAYGRVAKQPLQTIMDFTIWLEVADYWLSAENMPRLSQSKLAKILQMFAQAGRNELIDLLDPHYEALYHVNGKALLAASNAADTQSIQAFINRLQANPYPHYIGEALKATCAHGTLEQAQLLLTTLLLKNTHGRDRHILQACEIALANSKWDIISLLLNQAICRNNSTLLGQVLLKAGQENNPKMVKQIIKDHLPMLYFTDKWAVKSMPGFRVSGYCCDDLFTNHYWFVRKPIHFLVERPSDANIQSITDLLADFSLDNSDDMPRLEKSPRKPSIARNHKC